MSSVGARWMAALEAAGRRSSMSNIYSAADGEAPRVLRILRTTFDKLWRVAELRGGFESFPATGRLAWEAVAGGVTDARRGAWCRSLRFR